MEFTTKISIDLDDLIETLEYEDAETLIKMIDLAMADYEFTERIAKYLIQSLANECKAGGEPFDLITLTPNA